jgi:serine acetyltransferase
MDKSDIDDVLRKVVTRMVRRGIRLSRKKRRVITLARSASAPPADIRDLNPDTPEGARRLGQLLRGKTNYYSFAGLGKLSENNRIHWTVLNRPLGRRTAVACLMMFAFFLRAGKLKNRLFRLAGVKLGRDTEVMQAAWLDHFCPELISIGDRSLVGAFSKLSTHGYEGGGKFRVGLVQIGEDCVLAAGVSLGAIRIGDRTRVLPNTTLSPYFARLHPDSVVGGDPPKIVRSRSGKKNNRPDEKFVKNSFDSLG